MMSVQGRVMTQFLVTGACLAAYDHVSDATVDAMHSGVAATGRQGALMVTGCQTCEQEQADPVSPIYTQ